MSYYSEEQSKPEVRKVADLAENIVYLLPGCDDLMIRKTIQAVYREFCRKTSCIRTFRKVALDDGKNLVSAAPTVCALVDSVTDVTRNGRKLVPGRDYHVIDGNPPSVFIENHEIVRPLADDFVYNEETADSLPPPSEIGIFTVEMPSLGDENAPEWFLEKYGDAIIAGTLYKLLSMVGRTWANEEMAAQKRIEYNNFLTEARVKSCGDDGAQCGSGHVNPVDMSGVL